MDRIAIVLAMLTFMCPCIYGMEKTNPSQAVAPIPATSPAIQDKTTVSRGHEHGDSVRLSVTLSDLPSLTQQENLDKHGSRTERRKSARSSIRIKPAAIQAIPPIAQDSTSTTTTEQQQIPDEVVIQIEVPDLTHASIEDLAPIVDDLIRQAGLATFNTSEENPFYMQDLRTHILHAFLDYIHSSNRSDSRSSSSSSSSEPEKGKRTSSQEDQISALRNSVFQRVSSKVFVKAPQRRPDEPSTSRQSPLGVDKETKKELKQWFLRELELHDLRMREQERQLQDRVSEEERKAREEQKKTQYAILATITTTVCGIVSTVITYFLTHANQASE